MRVTHRSAVLSILVLLFFVVFLTVSPSYYLLMVDPDIGSQLSKGQQILFGLHPWVDVDSSIYGPAIFYLSALGQLLPGTTLLPEISLIFFGYLVSYLLFFRAFEIQIKRYGLLLIFGIILLAAFPRFHKYHVLLPQAIFLFGLARAVAMTKPERAAFCLAVACVLAGLFRIDFGAYSVVAAILVLVLRYSSAGPRTLVKAVAIMLGVGLLLVSLWLIFLAVAGDPAEILTTSYQLATGTHGGLATPLISYRSDLPPLSGSNTHFVMYWFFRAIPLVVLLGTLVQQRLITNAVITDGETKPKAIPARFVFLVAAAVFAFLVFQQASFRIDLSHTKQALPTGLFVLFLALAHWWPRMSSLAPVGKAVSVVGLLLLAGILTAGLAHRDLMASQSYNVSRLRAKVTSWTLTRSAALEEGHPPGFAAPMARVLRRVRELTTPDDPILFLPFVGQAYYFAERHFETPHGWWDPGRFRSEGAQKRFIGMLTTTRLVVDDPTFSFDRLPKRNARVYAPEVIRHIYSTFGVFDASGRFLFLSSDPNIWARYGRFPLKLRPFEVSGTAVLAATSGECPTSGHRLATINTLSVVPNAVPLNMPLNAGLLLGFEKCEAAPSPCPASPRILLWNETALFLLTTREDLPVGPEDLSTSDLIDTRAVGPGTYHLAQTCSPTDSSALTLEVNAPALTLGSANTKTQNQ